MKLIPEEKRLSKKRRANKALREEVTAYFPRPTNQQTIGHVASLLKKGNTAHATKILRSKTHLNAPDAKALIDVVAMEVATWVIRESIKEKESKDDSQS